jgi:hypothetical protein
MTDTSVSPFLDTTRPNTARIFNYLLGGTANFEIDRQAADEMLKVLPLLDKWVRIRHAFVQEAAQSLYKEGFRQFLDLGSGMPTEDHMHAFLTDAHIVYSDINPVAVSYGNSLFANLEKVAYIHGNVLATETILETTAVRKLFDAQQKTAIGLNSVSIFISAKDHKQLSQALYDWAAPGSQIFVLFQTLEQATEQYEQFLAINSQAGLPIQLYSFAEMTELLSPWQITHNEPVAKFLGLPDDYIRESDKANFGFSFNAVFLTKN